MIREKTHRLAKDRYIGYKAVAFTVNIFDRQRAFVDEAIFREMEAILIDAASTWHSDAIVYLFMPEHAHFILSANDCEGDVLSAVKRFKQRSGYWLARNHPTVRWQKDFYDHILRRDADLHKHVRYILNNPVRAGYVDDWKAYPFRGSMLHDLDSWSSL